MRSPRFERADVADIARTADASFRFVAALHTVIACCGVLHLRLGITKLSDIGHKNLTLRYQQKVVINGDSGNFSIGDKRRRPGE